MNGSRWIARAALLGALAAPGCGVSSPPEVGGARVGPHGGPAVALPAEKGYGEVVLERGPSGKKVAAPRLVVYFLGPDLKGPLLPAPTDVRLNVITPEGEPSTVSLAPEPDAKRQAGVARFASPPGKYDYDEL